MPSSWRSLKSMLLHRLLRPLFAFGISLGRRVTSSGYNGSLEDIRIGESRMFMRRRAATWRISEYHNHDIQALGEDRQPWVTIRQPAVNPIRTRILKPAGYSDDHRYTACQLEGSCFLLCGPCGRVRQQFSSHQKCNGEAATSTH
jgi:hypothetical protein